MNEALPWALGDIDLGDDVLEVMLIDRFAEVPSVEIVHGDATLSRRDERAQGSAVRGGGSCAAARAPRWRPATVWPATSWKPTTRRHP